MKHEEIKERFISLGNLIKEGGELIADCLLEKGNLEDNVKEILDIEESGDRIQDELDAHYKNEKNIPFLAIDQVKLLQRMDKTLDEASLAARSFSAFYPAIPKDFRSKLHELAKNTVLITSEVANGIEILYTDFSKAHNIANNIEEIRDNSLEKSFDLEKEVFDESDGDKGWKAFIATSNVIKKSMKIIEASRNVAEIITIMALKYL